MGLGINTGTERRKEITNHLTAKNVALLSEPGCSKKADVSPGMHKDREKEADQGTSTLDCR